MMAVPCILTPAGSSKNQVNFLNELPLYNIQHVPARVVPLAASRSKPFFFNIKLPPIKALELMARAKPT